VQSIRNPFIQRFELHHQELHPLLSDSQQVITDSRCPQEGLDNVTGTLRRSNACSPRNQREEKSPFDRRSGIDRRCISYVAHVPERRSGRDRRVSDDLWKEVNRTQSGSRLLKTLYGNDRNLAE